MTKRHNSLSDRAWVFIKSDYGRALILAVIWQLMMTVFGLIAELSFSPRNHSQITTLSHTMYWDANWYLTVINGGYIDNAAAPVFYPIFPLLVYITNGATFGILGIAKSGLLVNTVGLWLAIVALLKISDQFKLDKYRWWIVTLFLTSPAAFFLHMFYGEATFCVVAFWAYLFALKRKWGLMALALALLTATRLPAILFIGLCGLEFLRSHNWNIQRSLNRHLIWFLITPLGLLLYALYLHIARGNALAMIHGYDATNDWVYHVFNPNFISTIFEAFKVTAAMLIGRLPFDSLHLVNATLPLVSLVILFATSIFAIVKKGSMLPLGIFGLVSIIFFSLNNNLVSVHRYVLPCIITYVAVIMLVSRNEKLVQLLPAVVYVGALIQSYLFILFVSIRFAG